MQAQCWICPECHDDKHHTPKDNRCVRNQLKNSLSALIIMFESNARLMGWNASDYFEIRQARAALTKATEEMER